MTSPSVRPDRSYRTPAYEHATVGDAMRAGVISCPPEAPLRQVAQMMATEHIHCVVVSEEASWRVVSDLDLLRAAEMDLDTTVAGKVAASQLPTVAPDEGLDRAAQLMAEHEVAHLLVVERPSGHPVGVLSTLDVAGTLAWGEA
jgi:predicted transcriptional regulator